MNTTLKGLRHRMAHILHPSRVETSCGQKPKVARSSQPWAEGWNPFGILQMEVGGSL